jgi:hypothetical protein
MEEPELIARAGTPNHLDRCWLTLETKRAVRDKTIEGEIRAA